MNSPFINVVLFSVFWAIQIFISKLAFNSGAEIMPFTIQSSVIAIVMLSVYIVIYKRNKLSGISKEIIVGLLIANAIHGGLGSFFSNAGFSLTSAINAGFLVQFSTVTTIVLAGFLLKEKITHSKIITIVILMLGAFLLLTKGQFDQPQVGDVLIILACFSWSLGNVLTRKILKYHQVDSDVVTLLRPIAGLPVLFGFIFLAPLYPPQVKTVFQTNYTDLSFIWYAFFNALFCVLLWIFLNRTLKVASASYMSMMASLTPVLVAVLAIIFLNETLVLVQLLGVFLIAISGMATQLLKIDKH